MKKLCLALVIVLVCLATTTGMATAKNNGTTIQDGILTYSTGHYLAGQPLMVGYDPFGYNYQGHIFRESYANAYLGKDGLPPYKWDDEAYLAEHPKAAEKWYWPWRATLVEMKWNDAWISNKDCDGDGLLDRHYGFASYIGSGAWLTNHMWGQDVGVKYHWEDFIKIIAAPADAVLKGGVWYKMDGTEIGPSIWGEFAIIQEVYNDPSTGSHGVYYLSPDRHGLGNW